MVILKTRKYSKLGWEDEMKTKESVEEQNNGKRRIKFIMN